MKDRIFNGICDVSPFEMLRKMLRDEKHFSLIKFDSDSLYLKVYARLILLGKEFVNLVNLGIW